MHIPQGWGPVSCTLWMSPIQASQNKNKDKDRGRGRGRIRDREEERARKSMIEFTGVQDLVRRTMKELEKEVERGVE